MPRESPTTYHDDRVGDVFCFSTYNWCGLKLQHESSSWKGCEALRLCHSKWQPHGTISSEFGTFIHMSDRQVRPLPVRHMNKRTKLDGY